MGRASKLVRLGAALGRDALTGVALREWRGAESIPLSPCPLEGGLVARRAPDLVAQHASPDGAILAVRGYHLYRLGPGEEAFRRVAHLPCPSATGWLGHFSAARKALHKADLVNIVPLRSGAMLLLSGGWIFRRPAGAEGFEKVFRLRFWGKGVGRGVEPAGIVQLPGGRIVFGEYFMNPQRVGVRLYGSDDDGQTWQVAHEFPAGDVRHVHLLQVDDVTGQLWLSTGDTDAESFVAVSDDGGGSFRRVGGGCQAWRTCHLLFSPEAVYWGADTGKQWWHRAICRYDRRDRTMRKLLLVGGAVELATQLADGTMVLGATRAGWESEWDDRAGLWISPDGAAWKRLPLAPWLRSARPAFAVPRLAVGHGSAVLAVTCLNMSGLNDDLLIMTAEQLRRWFDEAPPASNEPRSDVARAAAVDAGVPGGPPGEVRA